MADNKGDSSQDSELGLERKHRICPHGDSPCATGMPCLVRVRTGGEVTTLPFYVCVNVRFAGSNSTMDRGQGMTIFEKLHRAGLIPHEHKKQ
jgi:hypothetical protein